MQRFTSDEPVELFRGSFASDPFGNANYDVSPDGEFLMVLGRCGEGRRAHEETEEHRSGVYGRGSRAVVFTIPKRLLKLVPNGSNLWRNGAMFLYLGVGLNMILAPFNLLPIPPLDGSHILAGFSTSRLGRRRRAHRPRRRPGRQPPDRRGPLKRPLGPFIDLAGGPAILCSSEGVLTGDRDGRASIEANGA